MKVFTQLRFAAQVFGSNPAIAAVIHFSCTVLVKGRSCRLWLKRGEQVFVNLFVISLDVAQKAGVQTVRLGTEQAHVVFDFSMSVAHVGLEKSFFPKGHGTFFTLKISHFVMKIFYVSF